MQSIKVKVLTVFMSFVMAVTMFPALGSNAATTTHTWWNNNKQIKCELNETTGVFTVTGTGPMDDYKAYSSSTGKYATLTSTDTPWYLEKLYYKIKKVVIGDGITRIGNNAFGKCYNIQEIDFQSKGSLKVIGVQAFYDCYTMPSVKIPYGVTTIGKNAFAYNTALTSLSIPNTVKTIAYGAFANCSKLLKLSIPASVTSIGDFAFRGNYKLKSVTGGAGLVSIGRQAFEFTYDLRTFKITSKKLSRIGSCCFYCSGLKTLQIKKTTKLKKKKVKGSLYLSSVKKVKVKKSKVRKYRKYFTRKNCGKYRVKVTK